MSSLGLDCELHVRVGDEYYDIDWRTGQYSAWVGNIRVARYFPDRESLYNALMASGPAMTKHFDEGFRNWTDKDVLCCATPGIPYPGEMRYVSNPDEIEIIDPGPTNREIMEKLEHIQELILAVSSEPPTICPACERPL